MKRRITKRQVDLVLRLVRGEGATHKHAAEKACICTSSVHRILKGLWRPETPRKEYLFEYKKHAPRRCRDCGSMIVIRPCLHCQVHGKKKRNQLKATPMKTIPVWNGAVIGIGEDIELKVLVSRRGEIKLNVSAPKEMPIIRRGAVPPKKRLLRRSRPG